MVFLTTSPACPVLAGDSRVWTYPLDMCFATVGTLSRRALFVSRRPGTSSGLLRLPARDEFAGAWVATIGRPACDGGGGLLDIHLGIGVSFGPISCLSSTLTDRSEEVADSHSFGRFGRFSLVTDLVEATATGGALVVDHLDSLSRTSSLKSS